MFDAIFFWERDLIEVKAPLTGRSPSIRTQKSLLAEPEGRLLNWLCAHMPSAVTPDWLTGVGFVGAVCVFAGYLVSYFHPGFFLLATLGIVINWFGDSLDGSLARYRRIEKSRYGYFIDHSVDAASVSLILIGLGLSPYVHLDMALFALIGYLLMCIYVFLSNHVTGNFQLSFLALGPTELRLALIVINSLMHFVGGLEISIGSQTFSVYDLSLCCSGICLIAIYTVSVLKVAGRLRWEDAGLPPR